MTRILFAWLLLAPLVCVGCKAAEKRLDAERRKACPEAIGPKLRSIPVELPRAATGEVQERFTSVVTVTAEGRLYLNGLVETDETLVAKLQALRAKHHDLEVVISADRNARHGDVVKVIDAARLAGITRYGIQVPSTAPARRP